MLKKILVIGVLGMLVVAGAVGYSLFKPPEEASAPIEAVPIAANETEPAENAAPTSEAAPVEESEAGADQTLFKILPAESEARFVIDEVLRGSPNTVVGVTDQVAGEIALNFTDPADSQIGTILVNARTLTTDSGLRNRTLKNRILDTNQYEFISFKPAEIAGLPESVTPGQSYDVRIMGDLTVRDVTNQVAFDATVTPVSETQLEGTATTTIFYADYGLSIPDVRSVTSVADEVRLEIDFVAAAG